MNAAASPPARRFEYGPDPSQHADLYLPAGSARPAVVVLIHGGFWRAAFGSEYTEEVARDLAGRGWAVWNIEYRRVGDGGGFPETLLDVAAAIDHLAVVEAEVPLDLDRVVTVGHSAGGHLAVWAASRELDEAPPKVALVGAISLAGVLDLATGADEGIGAGAVRDFVGALPAEAPERYAAADPAARVPLSVPVFAVHGRGDTAVPFEQSVAYVEKATAAGQAATLVEIEGDHGTVRDVASPAWSLVLDALEELTR